MEVPDPKVWVEMGGCSLATHGSERQAVARYISALSRRSNDASEYVCGNTGDHGFRSRGRGPDAGPGSIRQRFLRLAGWPLRGSARAHGAAADRPCTRLAARADRATHRRAVSHARDRARRGRASLEPRRRHARVRDRRRLGTALGARQPERVRPPSARHPAGLRGDVRAERLGDRLHRGGWRRHGHPSVVGRRGAPGGCCGPDRPGPGLRHRSRTAAAARRRRPVVPVGGAVRDRRGRSARAHRRRPGDQPAASCGRRPAGLRVHRRRHGAVTRWHGHRPPGDEPRREQRRKHAGLRRTRGR